MVEVVASNTPEEVAWAAYDKAIVSMHEMYAAVDPATDTPEARAERLLKVQEVTRLGDEWRKLFLGNEPRPAA